MSSTKTLQRQITYINLRTLNTRHYTPGISQAPHTFCFGYVSPAYVYLQHTLIKGPSTFFPLADVLSPFEGFSHHLLIIDASHQSPFFCYFHNRVLCLHSMYVPDSMIPDYSYRGPPSRTPSLLIATLCVNIKSNVTFRLLFDNHKLSPYIRIR